jgi:hypothetical protein
MNRPRHWQPGIGDNQMTLFLTVAIGMPALVLLAAWFTGPPSELTALPEAGKEEDPDEAWLLAPWWIL